MAGVGRSPPVERWWGPPTYPATVVEHDLSPGGTGLATTSPGRTAPGTRGWWRIHAVEAPQHLEFEDGFGDPTGDPVPDGPVTRTAVRLETDGDTTVMRLVSSFPSSEVMAQMEQMQMVEGITSALGQIPGLLAEQAA